MTGRLEGKVVIVTGSGQGLGRAIAMAFAAEGAIVVTNSRRPGTEGGDAATTADQIRKDGGSAEPFFGDVSDFDSASRMVQAAVGSFGAVHILVNNAGVAGQKMVWDISEAEWDLVTGTCLKGSFNCIRHVAPVMKEQGWGRIINTTSVSWLGTMERAHYGAAKAGVVGLSRAVARDLAPYNVTCNAYAPSAASRMTVGPEHLSLYKRRFESGFYTKEQYEAVLNLPKPEAVTPFLIFLCTNEAAQINGKVFRVYGDRISVFSEPEEQNAIHKKDGAWTIQELARLVPEKVMGRKVP